MPRFKKACERGYQGAIKLAAFCSGKTEAAIDNAYKKWAADGGGGAHDDDDIAQEELLEQGQEVSMPPENECEAVLTSVLQESGWVDPEGCEPEVPTADADAEAFSKVSMKAEVEQMLAGGGADDTSQKLAIFLAGDHEWHGGKVQRHVPFDREVEVRPWRALMLGG